jgi:hypothetical protein
MIKDSKFQHKDLVYNGNTKEDGSVRRVYERDGATMYEVVVPKLRNSWAEGYWISNWAEGLLRFSNNERLKASGFEPPAS